VRVKFEGGLLVESNEELVQRFVNDTRELLKPQLSDYGLIIYSHKSTLRRNRVLFYGFNPGYDPSREHAIRWTIGESLEYLSNGFEVQGKEVKGDLNQLPLSERLYEYCNLIDDQHWPYPSFETDYRVGQAPYQQHTRNLLRAIGHTDALITNLDFRQAAKPEDIPKNRKFEDACWKVHELIFRITQPNVIVTCAAVVDKCLERKLDLKLVPPARNSGYGPSQRKWKCKHWEGKWRDEAMKEHKIVVCQIPHMTYYDIAAEYSRKKGIAEWARSIVHEGMKGST
jgi:hypothetical protein